MAARNPYSARLPSNDQRDHLIVQVAKLYYDLDRTQSEIAGELGLTRWQVGKLLTEAKEAGIVRIEITPRAGRRTTMELELQRSFGGNFEPTAPLRRTPWSRFISGGPTPCWQERRKAEGGRLKAEGGRLKAEGGRRKAEGGRLKDEGRRLRK